MIENCSRIALEANELEQKLVTFNQNFRASMFRFAKLCLDSNGKQQLELGLQFEKRTDALTFFNKLSSLEDTLDHHCNVVELRYNSFNLFLQTHEQNPKFEPGVRKPCVSELDFKFAEQIMNLLN